MCCSTVPSRDSNTFLSPLNTKSQTSVHLCIQYMLCVCTAGQKKDQIKNLKPLLFILAFSSSVRCSVLVLITTFTLFTLKTWRHGDTCRSYEEIKVQKVHRFQQDDTWVITIKADILFTFASNPLTTSVLSLRQPQIPDLLLWKHKQH